MPITKIQLVNFRNFKNKTIDFPQKVTVILGPNASGKTNILEALFLLSTGKSFKADVEEEMIDYNNDLARITGKVSSMQNVESSTLEVILTRGTEDWPRKKLLVNGVSKRLIDFAGNLRVTLFGPWDMGLVTEAPSLRRRFMDMVLSQADREYRRASLSYEKGLRQRNRLLFRIREEGLSRSQLLFWNQLLIKNGDYISQKRQEFINFANSNSILHPTSYILHYDPSIISPARLEQYVEEEVASATTLVGPHRDDFQFQILNSKLQIKRNLAIYGSRGEQRMGTLWLKLRELAFVEEKTRSTSLGQAEKPTLLLDDIFSELDHAHRDVVLSVIGNQQTIITTADEHFIKGFKKVNLIKL